MLNPLGETVTSGTVGSKAYFLIRAIPTSCCQRFYGYLTQNVGADGWAASTSLPAHPWLVFSGAAALGGCVHQLAQVLHEIPLTHFNPTHGQLNFLIKEHVLCSLSSVCPSADARQRNREESLGAERQTDPVCPISFFSLIYLKRCWHPEFYQNLLFSDRLLLVS